MSGTVDDEVVRMRFDNNAFERGVAATLNSLQKLKNALSFKGADKGLDEIEAKAKKFDMSAANKSIDESARHWSAWRTAGLIAFATLVHRAVNAGINIVKAFTVNPIAEGFHSYETQINAAKIIMSNTGAALPAITKQLNQLQTYANQTVYSFADMAKNIGTFTAAGVGLVPATSAIKGMGNSAALSGADVQQLNSAMYQMSQAMSSGVIRLQDWNSLSNANMGGQNIQKTLMATAQTIDGTGPKMEAAIKKYGNFRNSLTAGWLTANVFSKAMGVMAGTVDKATGKTRAFTVEELKAKGYTQAHAVQLHKLSQAAIESATQIRTYTQMEQALKEEVGTAYGALFKTLFGDLNGATKMFTVLHTVLENALTAPIYHLNDFVKSIKRLGGLSIFIDAIKLAFHTLGAVLKPIHDAFREIFPKTSAAQIVAMIKAFHVFIENLMPMPATLDKIKRIFAGVFAVFDIGKQIVLGIFHAFAGLFSAITKGSGGFLGIAAHVGDMVVAFDQALKKGDFFKNLFATIGNILQVPLHLLGLVGTAIGELFSRFHTKDADGMTNSVTKAGNALGKAAQITQKVSDWFGSLQSKIKPAIDWIVNAFQKIGHAIAEAFNSQTFSNILRTLQTGLLAGIVVLLKKFFSKGLNVDIGGGFLGKAKEALEGVTGSLKAMQTQLKAKALMEIAIAVGVLAASLLALSFVDPKKMGPALKAMGAVFLELLTAMGILTKISGAAGFVKIPIIAASLDMLAIAILLLTGAVVAMSRLSWSELERGLTAIGALLGAISIAVIPLSANSAGMIGVGIGMTAIAVAMNLLFLAVKGFSTLSWAEIWKGLSAVGSALGGIAIAMRLMPKGITLQAAAILVISTAMNVLYLAVKNFSSLSWGEMLKGLVGVAGGLTAIAIGMHLMPPGMVLQAAALNLIGLALLSIGKAVSNMGKMSWSQIGKGLTTLAGAMTILVIALNTMDTALPGAAALLIVAGALRVFVPVLQTLGGLSWGTILKGLGALALSFATLGIAALLLAPVTPALLALGIALGAVGLAMLAFGAGAALLGTGLTAIAASGGAAIGVLLGGLKGFITLLPQLATSLATGLVNFVTIIGNNAPQIVGALVKVLNALLQAVPQIMPNLIIAMGSLIQGIIKVLVDNSPRIIAAGLKLLMDLLGGISNNIGKIVGVVSQIVVRFLNALASHIGEIIAAGLNLLVKFLGGIGSGLGQVVSAGLNIVAHIVTGIGSGANRIVTAGANAIVNFVTGMGRAGNRVVTAGVNAIIGFINGVGRNAARLVNAGFRAILNFINAMTAAVNRYAPQLRDAGWHLAEALIDGMTLGLYSKAKGILSAVSDLAGNIHGTLESGLKIHSPSRLTMRIGEFVGEGLAVGIRNSTTNVRSASKDLVSTTMNHLRDTLSQISDGSLGAMNLQPTIRPVLDLTNVQKDAAKINGLMSSTSLSTDVSYSQASDISAAQKAAYEAAAAASAETTPSPNLTFVQNNTSPKALSTVDLYRQTNNQLAQAKKALGLPMSTK